MKKIFLSLAVVFFASTMLFGQIEKGQIFVWGTMNFSTQSSEDKYEAGGVTTTVDGPKITNFGIMPAVGYFLSDNFSLGVFVGLDTYKSDYTEPVSITNPVETKTVCKQSLIEFGPWARYYIMPSDKVGFYFQGCFGFGTGKDKDEVTPEGESTVSTEVKASEIFLEFNPGIVYFLTKKIAVEAEFGDLSYVMFNTKQDIGDNTHKYKENGLNFSLNPSTFTFGVAIHL